MTSTRQDAWTSDEDLLLAEVVLRHIREGGTQLAAFEEVGRKLSRTSAACGFRWNSYVRKQYKTGIESAKKQRKEFKSSAVPAPIFVQNAPEEGTGIKTLTLDEIISYLQNLKNGNGGSLETAEENKKLSLKIKELEKKVNRLEQEKQMLQTNLIVVRDDYKALIEIMERAKRVVLSDSTVKEKVEEVK